MPLDISQPLHWDEDDVGKWLGTFKGKFSKLYGPKFAAAGITGEVLLNLDSASALAQAANFGTKRKEAKDLRTIWQGISTLKEKTKDKNYLSCPFQEWDGAKFFAWLHSPSVNLGQYAERFKKVHSGNDYGTLLDTITEEALCDKFLMQDAADRRTFFKMLGKIGLSKRANRGKDLLANAFCENDDDVDSVNKTPVIAHSKSRERTRPKGVGKLSFGKAPKLGGLNFGGAMARGSENTSSRRDTRDVLDGSDTDEDTPVRAVRAGPPKTGGIAGLGLGKLSFGNAPNAKPNHSKSRGGPKPKAVSQISFGIDNGNPRRMSQARRESLALLDFDEDDEGNEINLDTDEDDDLFDEDSALNASAKRERERYSTGTFSDSGRFQLGGSHEINEFGILSNSAAVQLRSYESKLEAKISGGSPGRQRASSSSSEAKESPLIRKYNIGSRERSRDRSRGSSRNDIHSPADTIIMAHQIIQREQLGRGAGGIVYRAIHAPTLRVMALKKVRVQDAAKKAQVMTEVEGLRCNQVDLYAPLHTVAPCPCLLTFYDAYTNPQSRSVSLLLEFMDGGDLNDFTEAGQKVSEPLLANIAYRLVKGLTFLHKRKQVHRDIKPHNVLMHKSGMVKISDLGIAKAINEHEEFTATFTGTTLYMSPERLKGEKYGCPADIWSVGLTVMTLAMGRPPIEGKGGFWGISAAVVDKPPPRLPVKGYSRTLRDFCDCCLKNDPAKRLTAPELMQHAWIRQHVADNKRQNLTSTVVRNNFMGGARGAPQTSHEAMSALSATWSKLSSTSERQDLGSTATRNKLQKVTEDVEAIRKFFFEKHGDDPAYQQLRPNMEAVLCYIKQSGLIEKTSREKCLKMFRRAGLL